jgi:hypothetical protein
MYPAIQVNYYRLKARDFLPFPEGDIKFRPMALWKPCCGVEWPQQAIHLHLAHCSTAVLTVF